MASKKEILKQILSFFVITSFLTAGLFVCMFNSPNITPGMQIIVMWIPGISAILTSFIFNEKIRTYGWRLGKFRFLGYAYILPIGAAFIGYGLVWITGLADIFVEGVKNYRWARMIGLETPVPVSVGLLSKTFIGFLFALPFVLGEEIGWSGFLTPKLLQVSSVAITSVVVGLYWALWHFPAIIGGFYGYGTPLWVALPGFTLVVIGGSILRTVLILKSKSLWTGVILHTSGNTFLMGIFHDLTVKKGYADYLVSETGMFMGIVYIIVAIIFWKYQTKSSIRWLFF